jgi:hypothetical protein
LAEGACLNIEESARYQARARHLGRLFQTHEVKHGGGYVGEAAAGTHLGGLGEALAHDENLNKIKGVRGMRALEFGIIHLLGVAVVGANESAAAHLL